MATRTVPTTLTNCLWTLNVWLQVRLLLGSQLDSQCHQQHQSPRKLVRIYAANKNGAAPRRDLLKGINLPGSSHSSPSRRDCRALCLHTHVLLFSGSLCNGSFFMCSNGRCISQGNLCDGKDDCGDRSDERNCNVNECLNRRVSRCTQDCQDLPVGYKVSVQWASPMIKTSKPKSVCNSCKAA